MPGAAVGVVGAGGGGWAGDRAGDQAVVGRQEAAGALGLLAVRCQGVEFPLALHVEERPLRGVALLAGRQAAQGGLQVLTPGGARLAQALRPTPTAGNILVIIT